MTRTLLALAILVVAACTKSAPAPSPSPSPPQAAAPADASTTKAEPLDAIDTVVLFPPDVATPGPQIAPILEEVAAVLRAHPEARIEVAGHCDAGETVEVAYARANLVASGLAARGVSRDRMKVETYGIDTSDAGRAQNRRVDFKVLR